MQEMFWKETKYKVRGGRLIPADNSKYLSKSSYLTAAVTADYYSTYIPRYVKGVTVDLGCGFAPMYQFYRSYAQKVICIDWENSPHKNRILDIRCDLSEILPLADASADTVILSDVLEHIRKPEFLLREIHRILRPKGTLLLNTPFIYPEHEKPYDYFRYTEFFYRSMAKELNCDLAVIKKVGGEREVVITLLEKYLEKYQGAGSDWLLEWFNKLAYKKWKTTEKRRGSDMCLGYFAVLVKKQLQAGDKT